jgi:mono/diheme cytochrome c family protein
MVKALRMLVLGLTVTRINAESLIQGAPVKAAEKHNPFKGDERAERAGAKLYSRECASCHGTNRE